MKTWLIDRFLPMWAKETVLSDNRRLQRDNRTLKEENRRLQAYIQGLHTGLRGIKRIAAQGGAQS